MHELGIVVHVIDEVEKVAKEHGVGGIKKLTLEIGEVSSIVPSYFRDCFEWSKKKTEHMQNTELEIIVLEALSYCQSCQQTYKTVAHGKICPHCGSKDTYLVTGNEANIKQIEV